MSQLINGRPGMKKSWDSKHAKDNRLDSCWKELSNLADGLVSPPNASEKRVPKEVLHYINPDNGKNWETTIPMVLGLKLDGKGGKEKAEGSGESRVALYSDVHWNVRRKVVNVSTKGVEAEGLAYLKLGQQIHTSISDYHMQDLDYSCQQALIEGGDRYITNAEGDRFWKDYEEMTTPPHVRRLHPNIAYKGMTAVWTRGNDFDADVTALKTELAKLTPDSGFTLAALEGAIEYTHKFITPLKMAAGSEAVRYIMLLSPYQASQLAKDPEWKDLMKSAEKRGPDNRALSGILGVYGNVLLITDQRSPIFNLSTGKFEYVTPTAAAERDNFYGYGRLNRAIKGAANVATGSMEIARILGAGALGCPIKGAGTIEFKERDADFEFEKEVCGMVEAGYNRLDFKGMEGNKEIIRNVSSALYFTSTPAISY